MPDFSNSKNKFKIPNFYGEGSHDNSSNHGTNKNYQKSGAPNLLKNIGNAVTGGIGKLFGKDKIQNLMNQNQAAANTAVNTVASNNNPNVVANNPNATVNNAAPVDPVDTTAIDPSAMTYKRNK